ncbi:TH1 protein-domain-containing protein [Obelidium mucronatum]|nr:TH1 protein-domain-containing protein [Obelidium mucronatum]
MIDEKIWLLAYISCVRADYSCPELNETISALRHVQSVFPNLTPDIDLRSEFKTLLDSVRYPIVAAGLLYWISHYISDPVFYESNSLISSSSVADDVLIFDLLAEISLVHPLQRAYILEILGDAVLRDYDRLSPLIALEVRKKFMDQLFSLLKLGFVIPLLQFMNQNSDKMDDALIIYFVRKIHDTTCGPYDPAIIDQLTTLVSKLNVDNLSLSRDVVISLLGQFLENSNAANIDGTNEFLKEQSSKVTAELGRLTVA